MRIVSVFIWILLSITGCSMLDTPEDETSTWSAKDIYVVAKEALNRGDYEGAIKYYEILEARFPFELISQQAQLDMIYAYYRFEEPESATVAADRFIKTYPTHPYVDYAYYLKGLVNFEQNIGILDRYLPIDHSQRDQGAALDAFYAFSDLITRFPDSQYTADAKQRMVYLRNTLAEHELHIAEFYLKRGAYVAAANRANTVVKSYQSTPAVPKALELMATAYQLLGMKDLQESAQQVLQLNYPTRAADVEIEKIIPQPPNVSTM